MVRWLLKQTWFNYLRTAQFFLAVGIFLYAALTPSPDLAHTYNDKSLHFVGNLLLFASAFSAVFPRVAPWLILLGLLPFSLAVELSQVLSISRQVDVKDFFANASGLTAGFLVCSVLQHWLKSKI